MFAIAGTAAALAGTAIAASPKTHRMDVPLPNGGVVHVDYVGDVAPKVTVAPVHPGGLWAPMAFPALGNFDRMFGQMQQQMRQIEQVSRQAPGMNVAAYGERVMGVPAASVKNLEVHSANLHMHAIGSSGAVTLSCLAKCWQARVNDSARSSRVGASSRSVTSWSKSAMR